LQQWCVRGMSRITSHGPSSELVPQNHSVTSHYCGCLQSTCLFPTQAEGGDPVVLKKVQMVAMWQWGAYATHIHPETMHKFARFCSDSRERGAVADGDKENCGICRQPNTSPCIECEVEGKEVRLLSQYPTLTIGAFRTAT
jgi:hypothetical protein